MYEDKKYKLGLKACEQILKRVAQHGETLALKGLFTHCLDRHEEGIELIKRGLKRDIASHICWHVLGLVLDLLIQVHSS